MQFFRREGVLKFAQIKRENHFKRKLEELQLELGKNIKNKSYEKMSTSL